MQEKHCNGASLAIAVKGKIVVLQSFGLADAAHHKEVEVNTKFGLGSISKTLTAATVLKLVDQGKLNLDDPILKYIPERPRDPRVRQITIRMCLNHSSGFSRPAFPGNKTPQHLGPDVLLQQIVAHFKQRLDFEPGSKTQYSNFAYDILAFIIERVSGKKYHDAVEELVLAPMGVEARLPGGEAGYGPHEAHRYNTDGSEAPASLRPESPGAGGWEASAANLLRFLISLNGAREGQSFLSAASWGEMLAAPSNRALIKANGDHYGLGWDEVTPAGAYRKNGAVVGVTADFGHLPQGIDWVILFNRKEMGGRPAIVKAIENVKEWPQQDLWEQAFSKR
jgi:CubicO group peptidase (beta-lactamase class C family)